MLAVDHVAYVSPDAARTAADLRARYGLGTERNGYHDHLGTRSWAVPLPPPAYVEILEVENEDVTRASPLGRRVLDLRDAGGGVIAWCVLVDDLDAVAARVGIAPYEGTVRAETAVRHWRTVTGPDHLPFFISYSGDEAARLERSRARYERVAHDRVPTGVARLDVAGDPAEYDAWLGPHDLPLRFVAGPLDGPPGLRGVTIATAGGEVALGPVL